MGSLFNSGQIGDNRMPSNRPHINPHPRCPINNEKCLSNMVFFASSVGDIFCVIWFSTKVL
jgi:hypothetical protein